MPSLFSSSPLAPLLARRPETPPRRFVWRFLLRHLEAAPSRKHSSSSSPAATMRTAEAKETAGAAATEMAVEATTCSVDVAVVADAFSAESEAGAKATRSAAAVVAVVEEETRFVSVLGAAEGMPSKGAARGELPQLGDAAVVAVDESTRQSLDASTVADAAAVVVVVSGETLTEDADD